MTRSSSEASRLDEGDLGVGEAVEGVNLAVDPGVGRGDLAVEGGLLVRGLRGGTLRVQGDPLLDEGDVAVAGGVFRVSSGKWNLLDVLPA